MLILFLVADAAAKAFAGNTNSTAYYNKFWELSKNFTIELFKKASYKLTCVIYTAWINAGGSSTRISENNNNLLSDFTLYQNYPNPFNPSTKISWQSPVGSWQTLKVFDVLGREVATLVDEYRDAGSYNIEFRIENLELSSGIYFYKLQTEYYSSTKKMICLK